MADKKNIQAQKEYNSLLNLTQSMIGKINKSMQDTENAADGRNKKLKEQISLTREVIKDIKSEQDLVTAIQLLRGENKKISQQDFGVNQELSKSFIAQSEALGGILKKHRDSQKILDQVGTRVDSVKEKFNGIVDSISDTVGEIPLIGKSLSNAFKPIGDKSKRMFNVIGEKFKQGFGKNFVNTLGKTESIGKAVKAGIGGGFSSAAKMAARFAGMLGPIGIAVGIIALGFGLGLKSFQQLEAAGKSFRESTGLLVSQTGTLNRNIASTRVEFANLGVSAEDVAKAAADFTNEFDGIEKPARNVLGSMVMLNKNFGIGTAEASKLNKVFQNIGGLSAEQSQFLIGQTAEMAKMAGVAPDKVIKDMANSSEYAYKYFQGSPQELQKAAVAAAKLGTSIAEAGKAADNLLDFQNSISKELEASAILGVNLNLGQARYLAANGKILESQQAILDQVSGIGDLTKLNVYEQQALADATGMEFDSLVNQQRIRERFGKLGEEQLAAALALADAGKDISQINAADLKNQTARMKSQKEMASIMEKFKNETGAIGTAIGDAFRPIAEFIMPIFTDIASILGKVLVPAFQLIGKALSVVFGILKPIFSFILAVVGGIVGLFGSVIEIFVNGFGFVADVIGQIGDYIEKYIISPIRSFFDGIGNFISTLGGIFGFGGSSESSSEGINDGVISPDGDIISTNPSDFLLATKNPAGLAQEVSAGGGVDMSGVIAQLQRLEAAFLSNKDVYMDNALVTAKVTTTQERGGRVNRGASVMDA